MRHPIVISSRGKIGKWRHPGVRPSLPYQGIARRAILKQAESQKNVQDYFENVLKSFRVIDRT